MAATIKIQLKGDDRLLKQLGTSEDRVKEIITSVMGYYTSATEAYAKKNAPWTDRTGNARNGLHATLDVHDNVWEIILAHSVWYGFFLEVAHSGRYAIIGPTISHIAPILNERLHAAMSRLEREI